MTKNNIKNNSLRLFLATLSLAACSVAPVGQLSADVFDDVVAEFAMLEKNGSKAGQDWFNLAQKARTSGNFEIAALALDRAANNGVSPVEIGIEKSRLKIADDNSDGAIEELKILAGQGFTSVGALTSDAVIDSLAGNAEYDALIESMTVQAYPCRHQPGFSDFDFWIGEWDVAVANGVPAGTNSIQPAERGCLLIENWANLGGGTGMSINYLDKSTDQWVQIWNSEGGSQINIRGGLTDEGMRMEGFLHTVGNGITVPFRALWTPLPDGRVRQFFEQSNDGGESWTPWFEGFYTRKN